MVWSKASWRPGRALPRRLLIVAAAALVPVLAGLRRPTQCPHAELALPDRGVGRVRPGHVHPERLRARRPGHLGPAGGQLAPACSWPCTTGAPGQLVSIQAPGTATAVTLAAGGVKVGTDAGTYPDRPRPGGGPDRADAAAPERVAHHHRAELPDAGRGHDARPGSGPGRGIRDVLAARADADRDAEESSHDPGQRVGDGVPVTQRVLTPARLSVSSPGGPGAGRPLSRR